MAGGALRAAYLSAEADLYAATTDNHARDALLDHHRAQLAHDAAAGALAHLPADTRDAVQDMLARATATSTSPGRYARILNACYFHSMATQQTVWRHVRLGAFIRDHPKLLHYRGDGTTVNKLQKHLAAVQRDWSVHGVPPTFAD